MTTTGSIPVPPAISPVDQMPIYVIAEDAISKKLERIALNDSNGAEIPLGAQLGSTTEVAPISDTALAGLNGRLQRIAQRLTSLLIVRVRKLVTFTCGTVSYAQYDAVGVGGGAAALSFQNLVPVAGQAFELKNIYFEYDDSVFQASQLGTYRLVWFNITPPSALADSTPWTFPAGDRAAYIGFTDLPTLALPQTNALTLIGQTLNFSQTLDLTGTGAFAYLIYMGATSYTPLAKVFKINVIGDPA